MGLESSKVLSSLWLEGEAEKGAKEMKKVQDFRRTELDS